MIVSLQIRVVGPHPPAHERIVLRAADELITNAVEHGFRKRETGQLTLHVVSRPGLGVQVTAVDDGWGFSGNGPVIDGNGFRLLRSMGTLVYSIGAPREAGGAYVSITISNSRLSSSDT